MNSPTDTRASPADRERQVLIDDLAEVGRGNEAAMARVYASTSAKLNALLLRMLRDPAEAEEVLQEVYLSVWRRGTSFDPTRSSPITWLVTIARNRAIDRIRSRKTRRELAVEMAGATVVFDPATSAIERIEDAERRHRLLQCFGELEERHRMVIRAAFFEGLTYDDLAAREGVPVGTMKSWMRRGLLRLRRCMDR